MSTAKPNQRKSSSKKLEPIDWHEFANDAVLNGNMSTLYQRPASEDASAYASPEALREIEKRGRPGPMLVSPAVPTVGTEPTVGSEPTVGPEPAVGPEPTVGLEGHTPVEGLAHANSPVDERSAFRVTPTVGLRTEVIPGLVAQGKIKAFVDVQDCLTLAGHVLYRAMYGAPDGAHSKSCSKGYRQLAQETHLDKDTVRDLISEFKGKGMVREVATYDPDTRSPKTYDVLSDQQILRLWRDAGLRYVTTGRKRPVFCTAEGVVIEFRPTVGQSPTAGTNPTVGPTPTVGG